MSKNLAVYLNKVTMASRKGGQECTAEFAATLASGTRAELQANDGQLAAIPSELAAACLRIIGNSTTHQASLENTAASGFEVSNRGEKVLDWKGTVLFERVRLKKQEDRDLNVAAKLIFVVRLNAAQAWPGRELVGRWLEIDCMAERGAAAD